MGVEPVQRVHQLRRAERLLRQRVQLRPLLGGEAVAEPLRGGRPPGQRVDQLLDVAGVLREVPAVLGHELLEVVVTVFTAGVLVQQFVEVVQHLVDGPSVLVGGILQGLFHTGQTLVEHLPAEQILDLLVCGFSLAATPVVFGQFLHGLRRRRRERLDLHLGEAGVVVERPGEFLALREHGFVEQLLDVLQRPVEVVARQQLPAPAVDLRGQPVGALHGRGSAAQQLRQSATRRGAGHHVLADLSERLAEVHRRGERVRTPGVSRVPGVPAAPSSHIAR